MKYPTILGFWGQNRTDGSQEMIQGSDNILQVAVIKLRPYSDNV